MKYIKLFEEMDDSENWDIDKEDEVSTDISDIDDEIARLEQENLEDVDIDELEAEHEDEIIANPLAFINFMRRCMQQENRKRRRFAKISALKIEKAKKEGTYNPNDPTTQAREEIMKGILNGHFDSPEE